MSIRFVEAIDIRSSGFEQGGSNQKEQTRYLLAAELEKPVADISVQEMKRSFTVQYKVVGAVKD